MSTKYKWVLNDEACELCRKLAVKMHEERPERPHPRCLCSIVAVYDGSSSKNRVNNLIRIQRSEFVGSDNEVEDGKVKALNHEWNFTAICRDNTVVEVNITVRIDGDELDYIYGEVDMHGFDRGYELSEDVALREAMDEIEAECPVCISPMT